MVAIKIGRDSEYEVHLVCPIHNQLLRIDAQAASDPFERGELDTMQAGIEELQDVGANCVPSNPPPDDASDAVKAAFEQLAEDLTQDCFFQRIVLAIPKNELSNYQKFW